MEKGIGTIILKLREAAGYTQEQLCHGICSVSKLAKMEANQAAPGCFMLDRLFGRLGKSTENLEYILPKEVYELYDFRYRIQTGICHREFKEAEILLQEYASRKKTDKPLHQQFIEQEKAQIAWMRGDDTEYVLALVNAAITRTIDMENAIGRNLALSAEELKLLLFRWEVCQGTPYERPEQEVRDTLSYIEQHSTDVDEKVEIYPYVVLLLSRICNQEEEYELLKCMQRKALELLRETGRILYMTEIIEVYVKTLENKGEKKEETELLKAERNTLLAIEEEFNVNLESFRLFRHQEREFNLDYEIIQRSRQAAGVAQEALCEGICTQETLSRIENGKRSPNNRNLNFLLERLKRNRYRIDTVITTEEFEVIEQKRKFERCIQRSDYTEAREILNRLEKVMDCTDINNQQYVSTEYIKLEVFEGKIGKEEGIEKLYGILQHTIKTEKENIFEYQLTAEETNTLNYIAILYYLNQEKEKSIEIHENVIRNYKESNVRTAFHLRAWGVQMSNLASCLEETGKLEEAMQISKSRIQVLLESGKGSGLGRSLTTMACILEQKKDAACKTRFRQALHMLRLMKMDYRYNLVKEYVIKNKIL